MENSGNKEYNWTSSHFISYGWDLLDLDELAWVVKKSRVWQHGQLSCSVN
jgi:hypothetical protein